MSLRILGIETSCDETAAAVVQDGRIICANIVASQTELHAQYGGVYPEMASRVHAEAIVPVVQQALRESQSAWEDLDAIAVTYGPGLPGSLLVGLNFAKGAALGRSLPLVPVNHLEGHLYALWLETDREEGHTWPSQVNAISPPTSQTFPIVSLIVSGGHTELILMHDHGQYERLGGTLDDAAGEAFDKVARMLGLGYPGGPAIEAAAQEGDPEAFDLPRAWLPGTLDFSFSGLKTAVMRTLRKQQPKPYPSHLVADMAASFQASVVDVLSEKTAQAAADFGAKAVLVAGGVSANMALREEIRRRAPVSTYAPPLYLCTDNAAMVAAAGTYHYLAGTRADWDLDIDPGLQLVCRTERTKNVHC